MIAHKLTEANKKYERTLFCEDTSLELECLGGLPGPYIKWFIGSIGIEGLSELALKYENTAATAKATIGYSDENNKQHFFVGEVVGTIVSPRGDTSFGWDPIFLPDGHEKTYGEMSREEKNSVSHRRQALEKLKVFLNK